MMIRFIFTDIDGVLNPNFSKKWNKKSIANYNNICTELSLTPVLTSTWRTNHTLERMNEIFAEQGVTHTIYAFTPVIDKGERGQEILDFLKVNECDDYCVIDDKSYDLQRFVPDNFVKVTGYRGLDEVNVNEIREIFNRK